MKNVKYIALLCALVIATTGMGTIAYRQAKATASADTIESVDESADEEVSESDTEESLDETTESSEEEEESEEVIDELEDETDESSELDEEESEEIGESEVSEETDESEEDEEIELGSVTISFIDVDGTSLADDIVILDEDELEDGLALYADTLDELEASDYEVVSDEVAAFDGDSMFEEDDVTYTVTLRNVLEFDVESAVLSNGIYVPNFNYNADGHSVTYYLDDGTEIAVLEDFGITMNEELWRARGIDMYFDAYCGGVLNQDEDTTAQIIEAYDMIFLGQV